MAAKKTAKTAAKRLKASPVGAKAWGTAKSKAARGTQAVRAAVSPTARGAGRAPRQDKPVEPKIPELDEALDAEHEAQPVVERSDPIDALLSRLPPRQQTFVAEYMANGKNATKAGIVAGYSAATADSQASRLLKDVKVRAVVDAWTASALTRKKITAEGVLDELRKIARFDPRRMFRPGGALIPVTELDDDTAGAIAGIEVREITRDGCVIGYLKKIKIADKVRAAELLGKNLKIFVDKVEHSGMMGVQLIHDVPRPERPERKR